MIDKKDVLKEIDATRAEIEAAQARIERAQAILDAEQRRTAARTRAGSGSAATPPKDTEKPAASSRTAEQAETPSSAAKRAETPSSTAKRTETPERIIGKQTETPPNNAEKKGSATEKAPQPKAAATSTESSPEFAGREQEQPANVNKPADSHHKMPAAEGLKAAERDSAAAAAASTETATSAQPVQSVQAGQSADDRSGSDPDAPAASAPETDETPAPHRRKITGHLSWSIFFEDYQEWSTNKLLVRIAQIDDIETASPSAIAECSTMMEDEPIHRLVRKALHAGIRFQPRDCVEIALSLVNTDRPFMDEVARRTAAPFRRRDIDDLDTCVSDPVLQELAARSGLPDPCDPFSDFYDDLDVDDLPENTEEN